MLAQKYKAGDVVELKSGGPKMTVSGYVTSNGLNEFAKVFCQWFVGTKLEKERFSEDSLQLCELEDQGPRVR